MMNVKSWLIVSLLALVPISARAEILTLYSDAGAAGDNVAACGNSPVCVWCTQSYSGGSCPANLFNGQSTDLTPPEGYTSFMTASDLYDNSAGWGIFYDTVNLHPGGMDLSRFSSGQLRFWLYYTSSFGVNEVFQFCVEHPSAPTKNCFNFSSPAALGQWHEVVLTTTTFATWGINLSSLYSPFEITKQYSGTFYVDDVRYVTSDVSSPYFNVALLNRAGNSPTSAITWSTATAAAPWTLADQYILLTVDPNTTSWGVQIYTDNTNSSPAYTGAVSSTTPGGGLVEISSPSVILPMAWEALAASSPTLVAQEPNSCPGNGLGCLWFYMQDHAVFTQGNPSVFNGAAFVTAASNYGIHYAQGTTFGNPLEFGAAKPPYYIYLEGNFSKALGGTAYQTNTLTVEYYTQ